VGAFGLPIECSPINCYRLASMSASGPPSAVLNSDAKIPALGRRADRTRRVRQPKSHATALNYAALACCVYHAATARPVGDTASTLNQVNRLDRPFCGLTPADDHAILRR
jgi:hypothetical protein